MSFISVNQKGLFNWKSGGVAIMLCICILVFLFKKQGNGIARTTQVSDQEGIPVDSRVNMDDFLGVNVGQCQASPQDVKQVAAWIRDYSQWEWLEPEKNHYTFTNALNKFDYDAYYRQLDTLGIKSLFVVQQTPRWISSAKQDSDYRTYPPSGDQDGLQPDQYKAAASFFYQLAARYGSRKVASNRLRTPDKLSGLNLLDAIEVYNEPDGNWGNHMTLKQYAALLNAVYDGNHDELKGPYGIKAADSNMLVSIGGLAGNLASLKKVVAYAGRTPFDIINAHYYTFRNVREGYRVAVAPEWSSLENDMRQLVSWSAKYAPGKPVWLTEIGWDTENHNPEHVTEQEAANYLIRSYLLALGAGIKKCFWFIFTDLDDAPSPGVFTSSGLFKNRAVPYHGKTSLKPKLTYWYNATLKQLLSGYYFDANRSFPHGDSTVYQYLFSTKDGRKRLSVLWYCPRFQYAFRPLTRPPSNISYRFGLPDSTWTIDKVVRPVEGSMEGKVQPYAIKHGDVLINLNATPVFIEEERIAGR